MEPFTALLITQHMYDQKWCPREISSSYVDRILLEKNTDGFLKILNRVDGNTTSAVSLLENSYFKKMNSEKVFFDI
jgi:hypothetical protein